MNIEPASFGSNLEKVVWHALALENTWTGRCIIQSQVVFNGIKDIVIPSRHNVRLDFYIPDLRTAIEVHGQQHEKPVTFAGNGEHDLLKYQNQLKRDRSLAIDCKQNNITLVEIWYSDLLEWNFDLRTINSYVESVILDAIGNES